MIFIETQKYYYILDSKFIFHFFNGHIHNVVSTLFNVANSDVDVHVVSTLIWRCPTLWRHINLRTTLKLHFANYFTLLKAKMANPLSANPTKWSNTLKQFAAKNWRIAWVCSTILQG